MAWKIEPATDFLMRCMDCQGCLRVKDLKRVEEWMVTLTAKPERLNISVTRCAHLRWQTRPYLSCKSHWDRESKI